MENEFLNNLYEDEEVLIQGKIEARKVSNQYIRVAIFTAVLSFFWVLTIKSVKENAVVIQNVAFVLTATILTGCFVFGLINHKILKYKNKNGEYFVTNQRIAVCNPGKKLVVKSIFEVLYINISREKDGYGVIDFVCNCKFPFDAITFYGAKDVRSVADCVCKINPQIRVNDDGPKIMGKNYNN